MAVSAARPFLSELGCLPVRQFVTVPYVSQFSYFPTYSGCWLKWNWFCKLLLLNGFWENKPVYIILPTSFLSCSKRDLLIIMYKLYHIARQYFIRDVLIPPFRSTKKYFSSLFIHSVFYISAIFNIRLIRKSKKMEQPKILTFTAVWRNVWTKLNGGRVLPRTTNNQMGNQTNKFIIICKL